MLIDVAVQLRSVRRNCTSRQVTVMNATPTSAIMPSARVSESARVDVASRAGSTRLATGWVFIASRSVQGDRGVGSDYRRRCERRVVDVGSGSVMPGSRQHAGRTAAVGGIADDRKTAR